VHRDGMQASGLWYTGQTESELGTIIRLLRLVSARTENEVAGVVGVKSTEAAGGKHLRVGKRRVGVANSGFGSKVVWKGGGKKIVPIHDTMAEVMKGKGGR